MTILPSTNLSQSHLLEIWDMAVRSVWDVQIFLRTETIWYEHNFQDVTAHTYINAYASYGSYTGTWLGTIWSTEAPISHNQILPNNPKLHSTHIVKYRHPLAEADGNAFQKFSKVWFIDKHSDWTWAEQHTLTINICLLEHACWSELNSPAFSHVSMTV